MIDSSNVEVHIRLGRHHKTSTAMSERVDARMFTVPIMIITVANLVAGCALFNASWAAGVACLANLALALIVGMGAMIWVCVYDNPTTVIPVHQRSPV
jgi:hypothetical protein